MNRSRKSRSLRRVLVGLALAAGVLSGNALAQISYSEDFEGLTIDDPAALANAGWFVFGAAFSDYPGCSAFVYPYGPFTAPNGGPGFSSVVVGATGQALNAYNDYNNGDHNNGLCIETSLFQERVFNAATDTGDYRFAFDTEVPEALGPNANVFAFIKLLDPNNGFSLDLFLTVDTSTAGAKFIDVTLDASADGKILQWGFSTQAGNFEPTGRWYDNISFTAQVAPPPPEPPTPPPPPPAPVDVQTVPTLSDLGLWLLAALIGGLGLALVPRR